MIIYLLLVSNYVESIIVPHLRKKHNTSPMYTDNMYVESFSLFLSQWLVNNIIDGEDDDDDNNNSKTIRMITTTAAAQEI